MNDSWAQYSKALSVRSDESINFLLYSISKSDSGAENVWDQGVYTNAVGMPGDMKILDGNWHHVVMTGISKVQFYVDGKPIQSLQFFKQDTVHPDDPDHSIFIGQASLKPFLPTGVNSDLDEFQIFDRILSAEEVESLYREPASVKEGLVGWWQFEKGGIDSSKAANHGNVAGASFVDGKFGKAMHFNQGEYVSLAAFPPIASREKIWELLARDFIDDESVEQMKWEQEDRIWKDDWKPGDLKKLASRYADSSSYILNLSDRAEQLAAEVSSDVDLTRVREIYHLSRLYDRKYKLAQTKANRLYDEIEYLQELHPPDDMPWNQHRESVIDLYERCNRQLMAIDSGDESVFGSLQELITEMDILKGKIPLRLPAGPPGTDRFGAVYQKLKYSLDWDKPWRIGMDADVLVRFDEFDHALEIVYCSMDIPAG